ncbi:alpha/beta fold hydrolase [Thalassobaculum fulvum]|nr:alpha/beta hydrolase [Thalassobaculum fulvum]
MPSYDPGDGHRLYYEDRGAGRPLVLLHGWACHAGYFAPQAEALAARFRVVVPDLRGHRHSHRAGDAPTLATLADDLRGLIAAAGLASPVLVGWSMGAMVAFEYARRFGTDDLGGLVVVDMTARVVNDAEWRLGLLGGYRASQAERAPAIIRRDWPRWVEAFLPTVLAAGGPGNPALLDWIAGEMQGCDPDTMAALWRDLTAADYRRDVGRIALPALILRGERSQLYGPDTAAWLAGAIAGAEIAVVADAGHAPHLEQPAAFNRALVAFVERIDPAPPAEIASGR